jgi:hypothetical protein
LNLRTLSTQLSERGATESDDKQDLLWGIEERVIVLKPSAAVLFSSEFLVKYLGGKPQGFIV